MPIRSMPNQNFGYDIPTQPESAEEMASLGSLLQYFHYLRVYASFYRRSVDSMQASTSQLGSNGFKRTLHIYHVPN